MYDVVAVCGTVVVGEGSGFTAQFVFIFSQIHIDFFTDCIGYFVAEKGNGVFSGRCQPVLGAVLIAGSFSANNSAKERKARESEVVEKYKEGTDLYINGVKKDNIDLNGVNLDNYDITVEKDKIYLKEK